MYNLSCIPNNYIGLRGSCLEEPASGLYINDLPGISFRLLANLATEETQRAIKLVEDLQRQAIIQVWNDIRQNLSDRIAINKVLSQRQYGRHRFDITPEYLAPVAADVGLVIEADDCDDLTAIRIDYIDIRTNSTVADKVLTITDGCTTKTYTFNAVSCQPVRIRTNFVAATGRVFVTVDASDLELEDNSINQTCGCDRYCYKSCDTCTVSGCGIEVDGWDGTKESGQAFGMVAKISCICSSSEMICQAQDDIALAVQMKMGVLIAQELATSKRCNFMVKNGKDDATDILLMILGGEKDGVVYPGEYMTILEQTVKGIERVLTNKLSDCITCGGTRAVETIP